MVLVNTVVRSRICIAFLSFLLQLYPYSMTLGIFPGQPLGVATGAVCSRRALWRYFITVHT
jgi:hypothetical protein